LNKKLILIGDSLTFGYGVNKKDSWTYNLSEELSIDIINKGINGDTTPSMLNRFYEDVSALNPDYIFIMGGTNDLLCGRSISSIIDNINEMVKDSSNKKLFIGIPPCIIKKMAEDLFMPSTFYTYCNDSLPILRKELINLCHNYSIKYIDFYQLTINNLDKNIFIDGIHLNSLGNNLILTEFLKIFII
jgi:lysophospholipase L1-like esterase